MSKKRPLPTCSKSVKQLVWSKKNDYQLFYLFKVSGLKQNYNYLLSDSNPGSDYDSNSDFGSVSMNLVIFAFFILCLHSSK